MGTGTTGTVGVSENQPHVLFICFFIQFAAYPSQSCSGCFHIFARITLVHVHAVVPILNFPRLTRLPEAEQKVGPEGAG